LQQHTKHENCARSGRALSGALALLSTVLALTCAAMPATAAAALPPTISQVTPQSGPESGHNQVTIDGAHFEGVRSVSFGAANALSYTVASPSEIVAEAPPGAGAVEVSVMTAAGASAAGSADRYVYEPASAYGWGGNLAGQLGDGTLEGRLRAAPTGLASPPSAIAAGGEMTLALLEGGAVVASGSNAEGELGDGRSGEAHQSMPLAVCAPGERAPCASQLTHVSALAAGSAFGLALREGRVLAWGSNKYGQLGDGTTANSDAPVSVAGLPEEAIAVAAGEAFGLALMRNGTVWSWGRDNYGQLGDGSEGETYNSTAPTQVAGLEGVKAIAAGGAHAFALLSNGTVVAWGENFGGELGIGEGGNRDVPTAVKGIAEGEALAVAAGYADGMVLTSSHTVKTWGWNALGELGDGSSSYSNVPVAVSGLHEEIASIAAGGFFDMALTKGGSLLAWGDNLDGELGDGQTHGPEHCINESTGCSRLPLLVEGVAEPIAIAAGEHDAFAIRHRTPPAVTGISPASGSEAGGTSVTVTGANLQEASEVRFGSTAASSFAVAPGGQSLTAVAPRGAGVVDVRVLTPHGLSTAVAADRFSYRMSAPLSGFAFSSGVEASAPLTITLPQRGAFSFGPLIATGAIGEVAKVEIETPEPAFEETEPSEYRSTGGGVQTSVSGYRSGSHVIGPVDAACTVPATIIAAEIPIEAGEGEARAYSATYTASCMLGPGVLNDKASAQVTINLLAPAALTPGESVTLTGANFVIHVPETWRESLIGLGANEVSGSSSATATVQIVG